MSSRCSDSGSSEDGEISVGDIRHTVQLTLLIMKNSLTNSNVTWMYNASGEWLYNRISRVISIGCFKASICFLACLLPLIVECSLTSVFYSILKILRDMSSELCSSEVDLASEEKNKDSKSKTAKITQALRLRRTNLVEKFDMLCRNVYAILPLYLSYLDHHGLVDHNLCIMLLWVVTCTCIKLKVRNSYYHGLSFIHTEGKL